MAMYKANDPYSPTSGGVSGQTLISNGEKLAPMWFDTNKMHEATCTDNGLFVVDINPEFINKKLPLNIKFIKNSTNTDPKAAVSLSVGDGKGSYVTYELHQVSQSSYMNDRVTYRELREDLIYQITYKDQMKFYISSGELNLPVDSPEFTSSISMGRVEDSEIGENSVAAGKDVIATGKASSVLGEGTVADSDYQHVQGKYNEVDSEGKYAEIVGGGTSDDDRKNIHTLDWEGNAVYSGDVVATDDNGNEQTLLTHIHPQYAPLESPELTGTPKAPTAKISDSDTSTTASQIATLLYVQKVVNKAIADIIDGAPEKADTLKEIFDLIDSSDGDVIESIANKAEKDGTNASGTWNINVNGYSKPVIFLTGSSLSTVSYIKVSNIFKNVNDAASSSTGFLLNSRGFETIRILLGRDDNVVKFNARRIGNVYGKISKLATDGTNLYVTMAAYANRLKIQQIMGELVTDSTISVVSSLPTELTDIPILEWSDNTHTHATLDYFESTNTANVGTDETDMNAIGYVLLNGYKLFGQIDGGLFKQVYSNVWGGEIYIDYRTGQIATRGLKDGTWQGWRGQLDDQNFTSYVTPAAIGAIPTTGGFVDNRGTIAEADLDTYASRNSGTYGVAVTGASCQLTVFRRGAGSGSSLEFYNDYSLSYLRVRSGIDSNRYSDWKYIAFTTSKVAAATNADNATKADTATYLAANFLSSKSDLNNITTPGFYYCNANAIVGTFTNCPTSNAFFMIVGTHAGTYQEVIEYMATASTPAKRYMRNNYAGSWGSWFRVYTSIDKPTYSDVGAAASDHTHYTIPNSCEITGTLTLSRTTSVQSGAAYPALIVGGNIQSDHMEIDGDEIQSKQGPATPNSLYLNYYGGDVYIGGEYTYYKIYARAPIELRQTGSVADGERNAVNGDTVYEYLKGTKRHTIFRGSFSATSYYDYIVLSYDTSIVHTTSNYYLGNVSQYSSGTTSGSIPNRDYIHVDVYGAIDGIPFYESFAVSSANWIYYSGGYTSNYATNDMSKYINCSSYYIEVEWYYTGAIKISTNDYYLTIFEVNVY